MKIINTFVFCVFLFLALALCYQVPFYYSWDMDLTTVQDLLLMQNNEMPTHMIHPGYGMYWLLFNVQTLFQSLGLITDVHIDNLQQSLQPMLLIAEQTAFLRGINAIFCILLAYILWLTFFSERYKHKPILAFLGLLVFMTLPGLWRYNILLIRTETYCLIFWAIAFLFTIKASNENTKKRNAYIMIAGLFSVLSIMTKIQSFFLIVLLPIVDLLLRKEDLNVQSTAAQDSVKPKFMLYMYYFILISVLSYLVPKPFQVTSFSNSYLPNKFFLVVVMSFVFLLYFEKIKNKIKIIIFQKIIIDLKEYLTHFFKGWIFILVIPLLMPMNILNSFQFLLLNFRMTFLRQSQYAAVGHNNLFSNFLGLINNYSNYICIFMIATFIFAYTEWKQNKSAVFKASALFGVVFLHLLLGVRDKMQDGLWIEIPLLAISVIYLLQIKIDRYKQLIRPFVLGGLIVLNIFTVTKFEYFFVSQAYNDLNRFFYEVYEFKKYKKIMSEAYKNPEEREFAMFFADQWYSWKKLLKNHVPISTLSLRDIEPYQNGIRVNLSSQTGPEFVFSYLPDALVTLRTTDPDIQVEGCRVFRKPEPLVQINKFSEYYFVGIAQNGIFPGECKIKNMRYAEASLTIQKKNIIQY